MSAQTEYTCMYRDMSIYRQIHVYVYIQTVCRLSVPAEDLVGALPREDHLDAVRLDLARHEEHGCGGADGGRVERLEVEDHIRYGVQPVLQSEGHAVVLGALAGVSRCAASSY